MIVYNSLHLTHFDIFKSMFLHNKCRKYEEKKTIWAYLSLSKNVSIKKVQKFGVGFF